MRSSTTVRAARLLGGLAVVAALSPWVGGGAALASGSGGAGGDADCGTRPSGVADYATCTMLTSDGATHGETWAWRTKDNEIRVATFPGAELAPGEAVQLCVRSSGPYGAGHVCSAGPDRVYAGGDTWIRVPVGVVEIEEGDDLYYSLSVDLGDVVAVAHGDASDVPGSNYGSPSPSVSPSESATPTGSPSVSPSTSTSASISPSASGSPSASTSPSQSGSSTSPSVSQSPASVSPETSVEAEVLAQTGAGDASDSLLLAAGLLAGGIALLTLSRPSTSTRRH
jgi:hypothetical protein